MFFTSGKQRPGGEAEVRQLEGESKDTFLTARAIKLWEMLGKEEWSLHVTFFIPNSVPFLRRSLSQTLVLDQKNQELGKTQPKIPLALTSSSGEERNKRKKGKKKNNLRAASSS